MCFQLQTIFEQNCRLINNYFHATQYYLLVFNCEKLIKNSSQDILSFFFLAILLGRYSTSRTTPHLQPSFCFSYFLDKVCHFAKAGLQPRSSYLILLDSWDHCVGYHTPFICSDGILLIFGDMGYP
jgi:hypothetical protein